MASVGYLPEDALLEILQRLPVKSIVRFRCVSRYWSGLLKSPQFSDMHFKFSVARDDENLLITRFLKEENKNLLSIHSNDESLRVLVRNLELQQQGYNSDESVRFAGSCNGIVCLSTFRDVILFNPAIDEFRTLPRIPCPAGCDFYTEGMGFGFDPASNDYKVVKIVSIDDGIVLYPNFCKAEIYNLSTDTWRELDLVLPNLMSSVDGSFDLFFNGRIHWRDNDDWILSMDISTEAFHSFRFPEADKTIMGEEVSDHRNLLVIKDSLALILYSYRYPYPPHPDFQQKIDIWLMKEYGVEESWSKQYSLGPLSGILRPIWVWKNEVLLLERVCDRRGDDDNDYEYDCELVGWNVRNNKQVHKYDVYGFQFTMGVVFYKETLLSMARRT